MSQSIPRCMQHSSALSNDYPQPSPPTSSHFAISILGDATRFDKDRFSNPMYFAILKMIVGMQPNYVARGDRALTFDEETYLNDKATGIAPRRHEDVVKLENGAARRLQKRLIRMGQRTLDECQGISRKSTKCVQLSSRENVRPENEHPKV